jgi:rfaE bifunctional protein nucleotidyltransferase chain/domain
MIRSEISRSKIYPSANEEFHRRLAYWRYKGYRIVFTNGCFDIMHLGHIDYLSKASDEGDILIIGLNTDESVRKIKGPTRPISDENSRAMVLASMSMVDTVVMFSDDTPYQLIELIQPDVLIKGSDYKPEDIVGFDIVSKKGGEIKTIAFVEGYSTSKIEEKIRKDV